MSNLKTYRGTVAFWSARLGRVVMPGETVVWPEGELDGRDRLTKYASHFKDSPAAASDGGASKTGDVETRIPPKPRIARNRG